jgi:beta-glucuronidase
MLFPQNNSYRHYVELNGLWEFRRDLEQQGEAKGWGDGFAPEGLLAVPASWNDQFATTEKREFIGTVFYQNTFYLPSEFRGRAVRLRVGAVSFKASVWLNGEKLGDWEVAYLPFEFEVTHLVKYGEPNRLVVAVNNEQTMEMINQGRTYRGAERPLGRAHQGTPLVYQDFYPYGGIHRPVRIQILPSTHILSIKATPGLIQDIGTLAYSIEVTGDDYDDILISLVDGEQVICQTQEPAGELKLTQVTPWSPQDPYLYTLRVELIHEGQVVDRYNLDTGFRSIAVTETEFLLNDKPVFLWGFGKHEDFHLIGKGLNPALLVKDFELLKWIGANSFRTSHYPYAEEWLQLADRFGFMVIDETPACFLDVREHSHKLMMAHKASLEQMIARDRHHPSVIMWSVANEPHTEHEAARPYFQEIHDYTRSLDNTRPVVLVERHGAHGGDEISHVQGIFDLECLNRYYGWYMNCGRLDEAMEMLSRDLDEWHQRTRKPIILTEFGADAVAGLHSTWDQQFTEEYQAELIRRTIEVAESKPYVVGTHVWNFADFATTQEVRRVVGNRKGVFTRERLPKLAAHVLRQHWKKS